MSAAPQPGRRPRVSVIVPSRLQRFPAGAPHAFPLSRAIQSVREQSIACDIEIIVGLDCGVAPPASLRCAGVAWSNAEPGRTGQAAALNAAVAMATGEAIAFLEDDDWWEAHHLACGLSALAEFPFVSTVQDVFTEGGTYRGLLDYPTPSGWILRRSLWQEIGPFDESYRYHLDSDWLGRLNRSAHRRCHLVERTASLWRFGRGRRDFFDVMRHAPRGSRLRRIPHERPQVVRIENPSGGMSQIAAGGAAAACSAAEQRRLIDRYDGRIW